MARLSVVTHPLPKEHVGNKRVYRLLATWLGKDYNLIRRGILKRGLLCVPGAPQPVVGVFPKLWQW